jgi:hypothetical protein
MQKLSNMNVNLVSSGHNALDHRIFIKEGHTPADEGASVRVFAMGMFITYFCSPALWLFLAYSLSLGKM